MLILQKKRTGGSQLPRASAAQNPQGLIVCRDGERYGDEREQQEYQHIHTETHQLVQDAIKALEKKHNVDKHPHHPTYKMYTLGAYKALPTSTLQISGQTVDFLVNSVATESVIKKAKT